MALRLFALKLCVPWIDDIVKHAATSIPGWSPRFQAFVVTTDIKLPLLVVAHKPDCAEMPSESGVQAKARTNNPCHLNEPLSQTFQPYGKSHPDPLLRGCAVEFRWSGTSALSSTNHLGAVQTIAGPVLLLLLLLLLLFLLVIAATRRLQVMLLLAALAAAGMLLLLLLLAGAVVL
jgi:hypothetical protein